jgi:geranylgeranyl transferase type-1 subunit beta
MTGDDLSRVDRSGIVSTLRALQHSNGSMHSTPGTLEADMRFLYSACTISAFINDFSGVTCIYVLTIYLLHV